MCVQAARIPKHGLLFRRLNVIVISQQRKIFKKVTSLEIYINTYNDIEIEKNNSKR